MGDGRLVVACWGRKGGGAGFLAGESAGLAFALRERCSRKKSPGPLVCTNLVQLSCCRGVNTTKYTIARVASCNSFAKALHVWCNRANFPQRRLAR